MRWIDLQCRGVPYSRRMGVAMRENEARHPISQRCLADALRTADQPGMRNASAAVGVQQAHLGIAVAGQRCGLARMARRYLRFEPAGAHANFAVLGIAAGNNRSRTTAQIRAATASTAASASI